MRARGGHAPRRGSSTSWRGPSGTGSIIPRAVGLCGQGECGLRLNPRANIAVEPKGDTVMAVDSGDASEPAPAPFRLAKRPVDKGTVGPQENGFMTVEPEPNQIYIKTIGPEFSRKDMEEVGRRF